MKRKESPKPKSNGKGSLSLAEFAHSKRVSERKQACVICRMPQGIRDEIKLARSRKVDRPTIIEWLTTTLKYKVDDLDFQGHNNGLHEQRETRGPQ